MTISQPYVFISHSTSDNAFAGQLAADLRAADFDVWVDLDSIRDGEAWLRAIQKGVAECSAIVIVLSGHARDSEWVERETLLAMDLKKPLYIARIDDTPLPLHLINRQYTDFREDYDVALERLVVALRQVVREGTPTPKIIAPPKLDPAPGVDNFFRYVEQLPGGEDAATIARDLYDWAEDLADSVDFGGKRVPGFHARVGDVTVFSVWAYKRKPKLQLQFSYLSDHPPYDDGDMRRSTLRSLNALLDVPLDAESADRRPTVPLAAFNAAGTLGRLKHLLEEVMDNLRSG